MRRTNYEAIATRYDDERAHWGNPPDEIIAAGVGDVLDVGCGTGLWLAAQRRYFAERAIRFVGLDASPAMLREARDKAAGFRLVNGLAEALPFGAATFDYVYSSFAYHHFADKLAAFDEIARVIRPGGTFRIRHMNYERERWWVYRFFPQTRTLDAQRFWTSDNLASALGERGFDVVVEIDDSTETWTKANMLKDAERRVTSQLAILDDDAYAQGLERLRGLPDDAVFEMECGSALDLRARRL